MKKRNKTLREVVRKEWLRGKQPDIWSFASKVIQEWKKYCLPRFLKKEEAYKSWGVKDEIKRLSNSDLKHFQNGYNNCRDYINQRDKEFREGAIKMKSKRKEMTLKDEIKLRLFYATDKALTKQEKEIIANSMIDILKQELAQERKRVIEVLEEVLDPTKSHLQGREQIEIILAKLKED